jgi:hypothetical protein
VTGGLELALDLDHSLANRWPQSTALPAGWGAARLYKSLIINDI